MAGIITKDQLDRIRNQRIVLSHGVFDIICPSHIRHLEYAKSLGDVLVVSITGDAYVNKGEARPHFNSRYRSEQIAALTCVDYVIINEAYTAVPIIEMLRPDFYVKGADTKKKPGPDFDLESDATDRMGGQLLFSPNEFEHHTTDIINGKTPD